MEENEISAYLVYCLCEHPLFHIKYIHKPNKEKEYKRFREGKREKGEGRVIHMC